MDYKMVVQIPIKEVPNDVSVQEVRVVLEMWLKGKIPDAKLIEFNRVEDDIEI